MKKIVSASLKQTTIGRITRIAKALGVSRSSLLDAEINRQLDPLMPFIERILSEQKQLKELLTR